MKIIHVAALFSVSFGLFGCVSTEVMNQRFQAAVQPNSEIKKALIDTARNFVFDPGSIRDAEISNVFVWNEPQNIKAVCVKFNSKNRYGAYAGRTTQAIQLANNKPIGTIENWYGCQSASLKWQRFPEANGLKSL